MYSNILIPTDGSELAGKAVQHGLALAKRIGAKVTVLTVLPPFHVITTDTQMIEIRRLSTKHACRSMPRKFLPLSPHKRQASHARRSRSSMSIPTGRLSIPLIQKAAI